MEEYSRPLPSQQGPRLSGVEEESYTQRQQQQKELIGDIRDHHVLNKESSISPPSPVVVEEQGEYRPEDADIAASLEAYADLSDELASLQAELAKQEEARQEKRAAMAQFIAARKAAVAAGASISGGVLLSSTSNSSGLFSGGGGGVIGGGPSAGGREEEGSRSGVLQQPPSETEDAFGELGAATHHHPRATPSPNILRRYSGKSRGSGRASFSSSSRATPLMIAAPATTNSSTKEEGLLESNVSASGPAATTATTNRVTFQSMNVEDVGGAGGAGGMKGGASGGPARSFHRAGSGPAASHHLPRGNTQEFTLSRAWSRVGGGESSAEEEGADYWTPGFGGGAKSFARSTNNSKSMKRGGGYDQSLNFSISAALGNNSVNSGGGGGGRNKKSVGDNSGQLYYSSGSSDEEEIEEVDSEEGEEDDSSIPPKRRSTIFSSPDGAAESEEGTTKTSSNLSSKRRKTLKKDLRGSMIDSQNVEEEGGGGNLARTSRGITRRKRHQRSRKYDDRKDTKSSVSGTSVLVTALDICYLFMTAMTCCMTIVLVTSWDTGSLPPIGVIIWLALQHIFNAAWMFSHTYRRTNTGGTSEWEIADKLPEIRKRYLSSWWFKFDLVYTIPVEFCFIGWMNVVFYVVLSLQLLTFVRSFSLSRVENPLLGKRHWVYFVQFAAFVLVIIVGLSSVASTLQAVDSWNDDPHLLQTPVPYRLTNTTTRFEKYSESASWVVSTLTTVGYGDLRIDSKTKGGPGGTFFTTGVCLLSVLFVALVTAVITSILTTRDMLSEDLDAKKRLMYEMLQFYEIPWDVQRELIALFPTVLENESEDQFKHLIEQLPPFVGEKVERFLRAKTLRGVPIFQDLGQNDDKIIHSIASRMRRRFIPPYEYIIQAGDVGDEMFFLLRGMVEVLIVDEETMEETSIAVLKSGSYFGEMALISDAATRRASVQSISPCELLVLSKESFDRLVPSCPALQMRIKEEAMKRAGALNNNNSNNQSVRKDSSDDGGREQQEEEEEEGTSSTKKKKRNPLSLDARIPSAQSFGGSSTGSHNSPHSVSMNSKGGANGSDKNASNPLDLQSLRGLQHATTVDDDLMMSGSGSGGGALGSGTGSRRSGDGRSKHSKSQEVNNTIAESLLDMEPQPGAVVDYDEERNNESTRNTRGRQGARRRSHQEEEGRDQQLSPASPGIFGQMQTSITSSKFHVGGGTSTPPLGGDQQEQASFLLGQLSQGNTSGVMSGASSSQGSSFVRGGSALGMATHRHPATSAGPAPVFDGSRTAGGGGGETHILGRPLPVESGGAETRKRTENDAEESSMGQ